MYSVYDNDDSDDDNDNNHDDDDDSELGSKNLGRLVQQ